MHVMENNPKIERKNRKCHGNNRFKWAIETDLT